jgi:tetratricopeptide (TPR) repeat protein
MRRKERLRGRSYGLRILSFWGKLVEEEITSSKSFTLKDYCIGLLVFFLSFYVYLRTLAPTVTFGDSGDFISSSYTLGLPHPTGYPTYTLLGHLICYLSLGNVAWRINLLSSFFASLASTILYFIIRKITSSIPSLVGALLFSFSSIFWSQAIIAEIYTLHIFLLVSMTFILFKWIEHQITTKKQKDSKLLYLFSFFFGLSLTNHLTSILILPAALYCGFIYRRRIFLDLRRIILIGIFFILGLSFYLYLPIRSMMEPLLDWANPTSIDRFLYYVTGQQYRYLLTPTNLSASFLHYLNWWILEFTIYIGIVGLLGIVFLFKRNIRIGLIFILIFLSNLIFSLFYRTRVDQETYYLPSFAIWAIFIGVGIEAIIQILPSRPKVWKNLVGVMIILPFLLLVKNYHQNDKSRYYFAYDYAYDILNQIPQHSILFLQADADMFPLLYHRYIEKNGQGIALVHINYLMKPWYLERLKKENSWLKVKEAPYSYLIFENIVKENIRSHPVWFTFNSDPILEGISEYQLIADGILFYCSEESEKKVLSRLEESDYKCRGILDGTIYQDSWAKAVLRIYANAYYEKAKELSRLRRYDEAILKFNKAKEIQPEFADAEFLNYLGHTYYFARKYDCAITTLKRSLKLSPNNSNSHNTLGLCYYLRGEKEKAIFHLKEALKIDPNNQSAKSNLELIYRLIQQGKTN